MNHKLVGGGGLGSRLRYVFTAGSPTAIVRHSVSWEGDRCLNDFGPGVLTCDGGPNGLLVERLRDSLNLDLPSPLSVTLVGDFQAPAVRAHVGSGQRAWVRQELRDNRADAPSFEFAVPGSGSARGNTADGAMLVVDGSSGSLAIALNNMHRYEPQAPDTPTTVRGLRRITAGS